MNQQMRAIHGDGEEDRQYRLETGKHRVGLDESFRADVDYIIGEIQEDLDSKKILFGIPQSAGDVFLCTSLFRSMKETYPEYNIYVATESKYASLLDENPYIYKVIIWHDCMAAQAIILGSGVWRGFFDIFFTPFITTQTKFMNYVRNGKDRIALDLRY